MRKILTIIGLILFMKSESAETLLFKDQKKLKSVNGGVECAVCTILIGLPEQLAIVYNETIENSLNRLCNFFPDESLFQITCQQAIITFGPIIINGIYEKETPDVICHTLNFCRTDPGQPQCHIFPSPKNKIAQQAYLFKQNLKSKHIKIPYDNMKICDTPIFKKICDYLKKIFDNHIPAVDIDKDGHSTLETLRGTSWKGKDCNDLNPKIRPGIKSKKGDVLTDSNCNGIYGKDPNLNVTFEEKFCKNSNQLGVAVLGDSISAHFHVPEQWLDAYQINAAAFKHLAFILENEIDWPHLSTITGFMNSSWPVIINPTRSIYLKLREKNRCNHRDYQNVAVNGARVGSMVNIVKSLIRDQKEDQPMLVFLSLVGNDVCNGHPDTIDHMTKPDEFYKNLLQILDHLDSVLPNGSHVLLTGLANGSILYEAVGERIYPLGRVRNDIKYKDVYTYLSCLQVGPCNGWMTTNATLRRLTSEYAKMLSEIVKKVSLSQTYKNFDMDYTDLPDDLIFKKWIAMGGEGWQLIEPADGFHTNQIADALMADSFWDILNEKHPDWLGPDNQFNKDIENIFGDQGGY